MWRFFYTKKWGLWSYGGIVLILGLTFFQIQIDIKITKWFGSFFDQVQRALSDPNSITLNEFFLSLFYVSKCATMIVTANICIAFFTSHFLFRWRTSMVEYYHAEYVNARHIEGASQRVQEDTIRFCRIVEGMGISLVTSIVILIQYLPLLKSLSAGIPILFLNNFKHGLVLTALIWSIGGTVLMIFISWILKLVGIEYNIQKKEAMYRKILVHAEDDSTICPKTIGQLFNDVKQVHYKGYIRYMYLNVYIGIYGRVDAVLTYVLLSPAIVGGVITLGMLHQITATFSRVQGSMQFIHAAWPTLIELSSIFKRLHGFEKEIKAKKIIS